MTVKSEARDITPLKFDERRKARLLKNIATKGLTRGAAAKSVGISRRTLYNHLEADPEFLEAVEDAELAAIGKVEDALFNAAVGYEYTEERVAANGSKHTVRLRKHGEIGAAIFILCNRTRNLPVEQRWEQPNRLELAGAGGGPVEFKFTWAQPELPSADEQAVVEAGPERPALPASTE